MATKKYDSIVVSNTYDLEKLVMYPEKVAIARTYEEIRHLISNGHIVEVRDEYSNVVVDNLEKLDMLYKPTDREYEEELNSGIPETAEVSSRYIKLPNGTILDTQSLMQQDSGTNGYNIPNYIQSVPNVIPTATITNTPIVEETKVEEVTTTEEKVIEETTTKNEGQTKGKTKTKKGEDK